MTELANDCFYQYKSALEREDTPELTITLPPPDLTAATANADASSHAVGDSSSAGVAGGGKSVVHSEEKEKLRVVVVRVEYHVDKPKCGVRFHGGYACTDNQVRPVTIEKHAPTRTRSRTCPLTHAHTHHIVYAVNVIICMIQDFACGGVGWCFAYVLRCHLQSVGHACHHKNLQHLLQRQRLERFHKRPASHGAIAAQFLGQMQLC